MRIQFRQVIGDTIVLSEKHDLQDCQLRILIATGIACKSSMFSFPMKLVWNFLQAAILTATSSFPTFS